MAKTRFGDATQRLLSVVREQIRAGVTSERALAKLAGVSQPHVHNVLAGKRRMAQAVADRLLEALGLSLEDLLRDPQPAVELAIPALDGPLGGGRAFPRFAAKPSRLELDRARAAQIESPCRARVADDEISMWPTLQPGDDILLDCAWHTRARLRNAAIYAIEWQGRSYLCHCQTSGDAILTLTESTSPAPPPERIALGYQRVEDIVRGEVVWFGRLLALPS